MADSDKENVKDLTQQVGNVSLEDDPDEGSPMQTEDIGEERLEITNIIIVTNVADSVFESQTAKDEFEAVFKEIDPSASFNYLKSFRRARIVTDTALSAARAKILLNEQEICGNEIKCFFAQPPIRGVSGPNLRPPKLTKQFLISPPASPPVGWEPITEAHPVINYDLISAIANLTPGESHELHPPSGSHPGIVVHVCENPAGFDSRPKTIQQTKCPERDS